MKKLSVQWSDDKGTKIPIRIISNPSKPAQSRRIPLHSIFEAMFHLSEIESSEQIDKLLEELEEIPRDTEIDFSKIH